MTAEPSRSKLLVITAWIFLLLSSGLLRVILQEVFAYKLSFELFSVMSASIILIGLILTFIWSDLRDLRQFFFLFLILVGIEWLVYGVIAELPRYKMWLTNPSCNINMMANQSLRLIVSLAIIASLLRRSLGRDGRIDGRIFRLVPGKVHAGNARAVLGVVYPFSTGCVDLRFSGNWFHFARRRINKSIGGSHALG